jgi:hypothetical protein
MKDQARRAWAYITYPARFSRSILSLRLPIAFRLFPITPGQKLIQFDSARSDGTRYDTDELNCPPRRH